MSFNPIRALDVEAVNPITQRLSVHASNLRRLFAIYSVQNRRQR